METGEIVDLQLIVGRRFWNISPIARRAPGGDGGLRRLAAVGTPDPGARSRRSGFCRRRWCGPSWAATRTMRTTRERSGRRCSCPGTKTVAIKSEEQQAILALHRMRQKLVKFRTAVINGLRGLSTEYVEVMPKGRSGMKLRHPCTPLNGSRSDCRLWSSRPCASNGQRAHPSSTRRFGVIERRIKLSHRGNAASRQIAEIPGDRGAERDGRGGRDGRSGAPSGPAASLLPGSVSCRATAEPGGGFACSGFPSAGTGISAPC